MVAGFLATMGTLGDRIGRRRLLLAGGTAFGVVSLPGRCWGCRGDPGPLDAGPVDAGADG
jgi:hypothetical protein